MLFQKKIEENHQIALSELEMFEELTEEQTTMICGGMMKPGRVSSISGGGGGGSGSDPVESFEDWHAFPL